LRETLSEEGQTRELAWGSLENVGKQVRASRLGSEGNFRPALAKRRSSRRKRAAAEKKNLNRDGK